MMIMRVVVSMVMMMDMIMINVIFHFGILI